AAGPTKQRKSSPQFSTGTSPRTTNRRTVPLVPGFAAVAVPVVSSEDVPALVPPAALASPAPIPAPVGSSPPGTFAGSGVNGGMIHTPSSLGSRDTDCLQ